eukprot:SAG11_NODE_23082_length_395_cov_1.047297_1_plen_51_part_10
MHSIKAIKFRSKRSTCEITDALNLYGLAIDYLEDYPSIYSKVHQTCMGPHM